MGRSTTTLLFCQLLATAHSFNLGTIFKPPTFQAGAGKSNNLANEEAVLLQQISGTANGKNADIETQARVLSLVRKLETSAQPSPSLLSDPKEAKILDGDWFLQYTAPSDIENVDADEKWTATADEAKITTSKAGLQGAVSGGGIPVDASNNVAKQTFDLESQRVTNEIKTGLGLVIVGGPFRQSPNVPLRAVVGFDTARVGPLDISFLFDIRAKIKGSYDSGWVETTYVSDSVRIGRGNKGSMFILTRDRDAVN
ncbi:hypothetical protein QTG54_008602 [Skeletonema marinoi]|uniref:Plastid lipid-associated protein/fibrillin conserved domain-containing protein n=1 Tax=Skeletonema marinoi TaxID=267567 RepID=A0AAD8Y6P0_9STRA|nr:hypothetical protein QTG54_008602 [Skeletonema marinoi]